MNHDSCVPTPIDQAAERRKEALAERRRRQSETERRIERAAFLLDYKRQNAEFNRFINALGRRLEARGLRPLDDNGVGK